MRLIPRSWPIRTHRIVVDLAAVNPDDELAHWADWAGNGHLYRSQPFLACSLHRGNFSMLSRQPRQEVPLACQGTLLRAEIYTTGSRDINSLPGYS
jgi:hypothetical protein